MTVPFERLGDGQVGRLVYQVIGQDGPIFNPDNIRYLSTEHSPQIASIASQSSDSISLAAGVSGLIFAASMGTMALSAAVLKEIRQVSGKIDQIRSIALKSMAKLEDISRQLTVIDIKVSENNLREALKHVARVSISENVIDLNEIKKLEGDVLNFLESVEDYNYGSNASFRLSSDVRDKLVGLYSFLFRVREMIARQHNVRSAGDPTRMLSVHSLFDYAPEQNSGYRTTPLGLLRMHGEMLQLEDEIARTIDSRFSFSDNDDIAVFRELVEQTRQRNLGWFTEIDDVSTGFVVALESELNEQTDVEIFQALASEWEEYWLFKTDMGLMYRVYRELAALGDYKKGFVHWSRVYTEPLGSDQLLVDCEWPKNV